MPKYEVLYDLMTDPETTIKGAEGSTVEMSEEEAAPLVAQGILARPKVLKEAVKAEEEALTAEQEAEEARQKAAIAEQEVAEQQAEAEAQAAQDAVDDDSRAEQTQVQARKRVRNRST